MNDSRKFDDAQRKCIELRKVLNELIASLAVGDDQLRDALTHCNRAYVSLCDAQLEFLSLSDKASK